MPPAYLKGPAVAPMHVQRAGGWCCLGKAKHDAPEVAFKVAKRRNRLGRRNRLRGVNPYRCPQCGQWHLGGRLVGANGHRSR
jgi:hypothetical protein